VRLRPSLDDDDDDDGKKRKDDKGAWDVKKSGAQDSIVERGVLRKVEGKNYFNVDQVFDENAHTSFLYKNIARSMVHTVLNGKHATIFMYGQTGAG
jgi:Kinesin motor domain